MPKVVDNYCVKKVDEPLKKVESEEERKQRPPFGILESCLHLVRL